MPHHGLNEDLERNPLHTLMRNTETDENHGSGTMQVYDPDQRKALGIKNITIGQNRKKTRGGSLLAMDSSKHAKKSKRSSVDQFGISSRKATYDGGS